MFTSSPFCGFVRNPGISLGRSEAQPAGHRGEDSTQLFFAEEIVDHFVFTPIRSRPPAVKVRFSRWTKEVGAPFRAAMTRPDKHRGPAAKFPVKEIEKLGVTSTGNMLKPVDG